MKKYSFLVFLIAVFACESSFEVEDLNIFVTGRIINESTGQPAKGINISLRIFTGSGWQGGSNHVLANARTDDNGIYHLTYRGENTGNGTYLYLNDEPYDANYSTEYFSIFNGDSYFENSLWQNTILTVHMSSQNPLEPRTYTLWLPGVGTSVETVFTSNRAKGNFYNTVRLNYTRNGMNYEIIDSVYCPINEETDFVLKY